MNPMLRRLLSIFLLSLTAGLSQAEKKPYTLPDLQALDQKKAWEELIVHLADVPPAERNEDWNRIVERACLRPDMTDFLRDYCLRNLRAVSEAEPQNAEFSWKAGQWARANMAPWSAVPFFDKALSAGDARCKDENVQQAVVAGLGQSAGREPEIVRQSQNLAFKTCWPALKDPVLKALNSGGAAQENSCPALLEKGALTGYRARLCKGK